MVSLFFISLFPFRSLQVALVFPWAILNLAIQDETANLPNQWLEVGVVTSARASFFIHGYKAKTPPKRGSRRSN